MLIVRDPRASANPVGDHFGAVVPRLLSMRSPAAVQRPVARHSARTDAAIDAKRALDVIVSAFLLALLAPLLLAISILILADSDGPVFFRQKRVGLGGRTFRIVKFRTMNVMEDGDTVVQAHERDARITRIGRYLRKSSLDELPQLLNVLAGDMSLVGPRPHAVSHDRYYAALIADYTLRHRVKPGITGWAQVHGLRGATSTVEAMQARVTHDLWYARHASLALDVAILLRTPAEVLHQRNAL